MDDPSAFFDIFGHLFSYGVSYKATTNDSLKKSAEQERVLHLRCLADPDKHKAFLFLQREREYKKDFLLMNSSKTAAVLSYLSQHSVLGKRLRD